LAALVAFYNADAFYVYDFQAIGLEGLTKGDLERAGEFVGHNIFAVNPGRVEEALSRIPEIRSARVSLGFPHQLTIHIQEREPVITWIAGSDLYWIDESGISFRPRSSRTDLPVVRDLEQSAVQPGARVQSDGISAALALRAAWPDAPRQVDWSADRGLALTEAHGWRIYLGNADQMEGKIAILRALLAQLVSQNAKVRFIDLSQGDPFYQ
jgi:cell division septal protein FtsQ